MQGWIEYWKNRADLIEVWRPHNWVNAKDYRLKQKLKKNSCGRPLKTPLQIQADGTINMCCFDFDGKLTLGNLKTESLKEIFSSDIFKRISSCHLKGDFTKSDLICRDCDQRNFDKSGVMMYSSKFDPIKRVKMVSTTYEEVAQ